jgi:hypothetical protein
MSVFQIETLDLSKVWTIEELSKDYAERVVELYGGNRPKTTEALSVFLTSLWRILRRKCNRSRVMMVIGDAGHLIKRGTHHDCVPAASKPKGSLYRLPPCLVADPEGV